MAVSAETLASVKLSLGITSSALYDTEITDLIEAGTRDLAYAVHAEVDIADPLILQAVKTYVRMSFHSPSDYDRLRAAYEEQKGMLMTATGYTEWGEADG